MAREPVVCSAALSRRRVSSAVVAGLATALLLGACGGSPESASEPAGRFTVEVPTTSFPSAQRITQQTHMVITVRNPGPRTVPDPAVTICNISCGAITGKWHQAPIGEGTSVLPFAVENHQPYEANRSKQVWIVDRAPNPTPCVLASRDNKGYNCASGGPGGNVSVASNTWALGHPLKPGGTARFDWAVTAVCPGRYTVAWVVAAGLFGGPKAVLSNGSVPHGTFTVTITAAPQQAYVDNSGRIVASSGPEPAPNGQNPTSPTTLACEGAG